MWNVECLYEFVSSFSPSSESIRGVYAMRDVLLLLFKRGGDDVCIS